MISDDSNTQPYISIIIATLNVKRTINECLDSIIQQVEPSQIEILIKDGGSTDETINLLEKYNKHIRYWESTPDSGVYDAWNKILPKASGAWVLFLGADDLLFNMSVISNSVAILKELEPSIDIAYGRVRLVNKDNETIVDVGKNWEKSRKCMKEKMCIPHQGVFHKRSLFNRFGNFNTEYRISSDYDFIRRINLDQNIYYMGLIVSCMHVGGISSDQKNTFVRLEEIRQINKKHGSGIPGPLWLITYINACFRHSLFFLLGEKSGKYVLDKIRKIFGLPLFWTKL
jgi:glycosyltransferase involved in cell wall biosynthesis